MFGLDEQSALLKETLPDTEYFKVISYLVESAFLVLTVANQGLAPLHFAHEIWLDC